MQTGVNYATDECLQDLLTLAEHHPVALIGAILRVVDAAEQPHKVTAEGWRRIRRYYYRAFPHGTPKDWLRLCRKHYADSPLARQFGVGNEHEVEAALRWAHIAMTMCPRKPFKLEVVQQNVDPRIAYTWTKSYATERRRAQAMKDIDAFYAGEFKCKLA